MSHVALTSDDELRKHVIDRQHDYRITFWGSMISAGLGFVLIAICLSSILPGCDYQSRRFASLLVEQRRIEEELSTTKEQQNVVATEEAEIKERLVFAKDEFVKAAAEVARSSDELVRFQQFFLVSTESIGDFKKSEVIVDNLLGLLTSSTQMDMKTVPLQPLLDLVSGFQKREARYSQELAPWQARVVSKSNVDAADMIFFDVNQTTPEYGSTYISGPRSLSEARLAVASILERIGTAREKYAAGFPMRRIDTNPPIDKDPAPPEPKSNNAENPPAPPVPVPMKVSMVKIDDARLGDVEDELNKSSNDAHYYVWPGLRSYTVRKAESDLKALDEFLEKDENEEVTQYIRQQNRVAVFSRLLSALRRSLGLEIPLYSSDETTSEAIAALSDPQGSEKFRGKLISRISTIGRTSSMLEVLTTEIDRGFRDQRQNFDPEALKIRGKLDAALAVAKTKHADLNKQIIDIELSYKAKHAAKLTKDRDVGGKESKLAGVNSNIAVIQPLLKNGPEIGGSTFLAGVAGTLTEAIAALFFILARRAHLSLTEMITLLQQANAVEDAVGLAESLPSPNTRLSLA